MYNTRQAAAILNVDYHCLYHYIREKKIDLAVFGKCGHVWTDKDIEKMRKRLAELKAKREMI
jgi:predicted site-specific integrase-resolvase